MNFSMTASSVMRLQLPSGAGYGAVACFAFVFFGVTSTLCITASEVDGRLPYNTTSSVLVTEILKFLLSCSCWYFTGDSATVKKYDDEPQRSREGKLNLQTFFLYSIPGLMYAIQNQLLYYAVFHLQPALFQLLSNLKFVSTALLARFVMGKMLTTAQWVGILCLVLGSVVSRGSMLCSVWNQWVAEDQMSLESSKESGSKSLILGIILVLSTSTISGISGIANEYLLKRVDSKTPFMLKNMQLYFWGIIFNLSGAIFENTGQGFFHGFNWWVWIVIGLKAAEGMSISFIMKYLDNIVKCFCSAILVYVMTICSRGLFDEQIDLFFVVGLAVVTVALVLYFGLHNEVKMWAEAQRKVLGPL